MANPNVTSASVTFAPTVSVAALKTALKQMDADRRNRVKEALKTMLKNLNTGN